MGRIVPRSLWLRKYIAPVRCVALMLHLAAAMPRIAYGRMPKNCVLLTGERLRRSPSLKIYAETCTYKVEKFIIMPHKVLGDIFWDVVPGDIMTYFQFQWLGSHTPEP